MYRLQLRQAGPTVKALMIQYTRWYPDKALGKTGTPRTHPRICGCWLKNCSKRACLAQARNSMVRHNVRSKPYSISETSSRDAIDNTIVQPACTMGQGMNVDHVRSREVGNGLPRRPSSPRESARVARIRDVMWDWEVRTRHADRVHPGTAGPQQRHSESDSGTATSLGFYELVASKRDDGKLGTVC